MIYLESPLYQWDVNRKIIVLDDCITEVHFSNVTCEKAFVCAVYEEEVTNGTESIIHRVADIPNILLQNNFALNVYAVCENQTKAKRVYPIWSKKKPDDYIYTETEVLTFKSLENRIDEVENNIPYYKRELILNLTQADFTTVMDDDGFTSLQYTTSKFDWIKDVENLGFELSIPQYEYVGNEKTAGLWAFNENETGVVYRSMDPMIIDNGYTNSENAIIEIYDVDDVESFTFKLYKINIKRLPIECENQIVHISNSETGEITIPPAIFINTLDKNNVVGLENGVLCLHSDFVNRVYASPKSIQLTSTLCNLTNINKVGDVYEYMGSTLKDYDSIEVYNITELYWIWVRRNNINYFVRLTLVNDTEKAKAEWTGNFFTKNGEFYWVRINRTSTEDKVDIFFKRML